jgi:hypothetical protein
VQEDILTNSSRYSEGTTIYQSYLKCYCAACTLGCGDKATSEPAFCQAYFENENRLLVLTMVSVGGIVIINQVNARLAFAPDVKFRNIIHFENENPINVRMFFLNIRA